MKQPTESKTTPISSVTIIGSPMPEGEYIDLLKAQIKTLNEENFRLNQERHRYRWETHPSVDVDKLFTIIEHGDAEHRAWLRKKLNEYFEVQL